MIQCLLTYLVTVAHRGFCKRGTSQRDQGGHSPGKPGKVREFQSGQGKVRENGKKVRETEICFRL